MNARALVVYAVWLIGAGPVSAADFIDRLTLGDAVSEAAHGFAMDGSESFVGGLGSPARRLLPRGATNWEGGRISFTMAVDPARTNYFTARFWGDDVAENVLILFVEGKQIGYRHLGDHDVLDHGSVEPACNGRFFYKTAPLPYALTRGRTNVACEIRSTGRIWGYGNHFADYQKPMTSATRGIYALYTHLDGCFEPPADEPRGARPEVKIRATPGPEVISNLQMRINGLIAGLLKSRSPLSQEQVQSLAMAYHETWTTAYRNSNVVDVALRALDKLYTEFAADPYTTIEKRPGWIGLGPAGDVVWYLNAQLQPRLDEAIDNGKGAKVRRRTAWAEMLAASRDQHRRSRRWYTNQSMIIDLNIAAANRGVAVLDPTRALRESEVLGYLYESVGLAPWLGSVTTNETRTHELGGQYLQLTRKGLTRELGYVGGYGEVLDWMAKIYNVTRREVGGPGDPDVLRQMIKLARARAYFRYPAVDPEGFRAMRLEAVVGWRDAGHYPGEITYSQLAKGDGGPLDAVGESLDPALSGYTQQMLDDHQLFPLIDARNKTLGSRLLPLMLTTPRYYEAIRRQSPRAERLPMSEGQPDFVWADEENGVLAIKNGDEILYASLYWRARYAINFLARVHHITPRFDRIADVMEHTEFEPSGLMYTRPDWVNWGFGNGGQRYPGGLHSAHAGEVLPIARVPADVAFKPGDENVYAGRGTYYRLQYGPYLIGMNCSTGRVFALAVPAGLPMVRLPSHERIAAGTTLQIPPLSTTVLFQGN